MIKERKQSILAALVISFCFLFICSRSSFLYVFNNWDDANSYFTMGKMMMNGGVIYRDLFDQKGPLLYFIYGIAYLISNTTFSGVFLMEIVSMTVFLLAVYRIFRLYLRHVVSLGLLPFVAFSITVSKSFYWGGCAEEFCLPFLAWGLFFSAKYWKEEYPSPPKKKMVVLCGFLAGCIMLIKFNVLGLYFAWMGMIALLNLTRTNWKESLKSCLLFLVGMGLPLIPWLIYFGIHNALDDWYFAYIYCNVFLYSDLYYESIDVGQKIYDLAKIMYWLVIDNCIYFIPIIFGFGAVLFSRKMRWYEKINVYALFGFLFLGIYVGGTSLFYYSLPLSLFSVIGYLVVGMAAEKLADRWRKILIPGSAAVCAGLLILAWNLSMNTGYADQKEEGFYLYTFRDIVLEEESPTLLNISCLDAGLFTLADIMPNCRYFQSNAVHGFDEVKEEQLRYIKEGQTDFVLARDVYPDEIVETYELAGEEQFTSGDKEFTYYLFRKK